MPLFPAFFSARVAYGPTSDADEWGDGHHLTVTILDAAKGTIRIASTALPVGSFYYSIRARLADTGGKVETVMRGRLTVVPDVIS